MNKSPAFTNHHHSHSYPIFTNTNCHIQITLFYNNRFLTLSDSWTLSFDVLILSNGVNDLVGYVAIGLKLSASMFIFRVL